METGRTNKIQSNTFNLDLASEYQLLVQIGLEQFAYCISNINTNNIEYFKSFITNNDITKIISTDEILRLKFIRSSIAFANFPHTLVPDKVFSENNKKEILELNSDTYEIIDSDKLTGIDAHLIYTIPKEINDIIYTFFPDAQRFSQQTILIEQFNTMDNQGDNAYLYINAGTLHITIFRDKKLIFNNSFSFNTKEDILYFTLFVFEQLKLDTETVNTILYGEILEKDKNHQLLYEYIRNIRFGSKPKKLKFSEEFNNIKAHQFYPLFSQIR